MTRHRPRQLLGLAIGAGLFGIALLGIAPPGQEAPPAAVAPAPTEIPISSASTEIYDPEWAGHPLRIVAYALHPVGVILDYTILRPAWWLGSHEPLRTLFGRDADD
jgi:hypothetical protein